MSVTWTERERPPVTRWERVVQDALWNMRSRAMSIAAHADFRGWRDRAYRFVARVEERWARRVSQADLHLCACPVCRAPKMHDILRPGTDASTNLKSCFGCQTVTAHPSEH